MKELILSAVETLLTPVTVALVVMTTWVLRGKVREIIKTTGIREVEVTKDSVKATFVIEEFAKETFRKQGMNSPSSEDVQEMVTLVGTFGPFVSGRRVLWVDNHPENNRLERKELVKWGVDVQTRRTTEEAMAELRDDQDMRFDLMISDWYRGGQPEGQRLLELMSNAQPPIRVPLVYYFSAPGDAVFKQIRAKALALGAIGATSSPRELLRWVFAELVHATLLDTEVDLRL